jgi:hypothetical protein
MISEAEAVKAGGISPTIIYTYHKNRGGVKDIFDKLCEMLSSHDVSLALKVRSLPRAAHFSRLPFLDTRALTLPALTWTLS